MIAGLGAEVVVSATQAPPPDFDELAGNLPLNTRWIVGPAGRAGQLNRGVRTGSGEWLWLLHADSRPSAEALEQVARAGLLEPGVYHFALAFADDGPALTRLNAIGANLRSRLLGLPFGDQGLLVHRQVFDRLKGFSETVGRGEDLDFVVRAGVAGFPPRRLPGTLTTSARRYRDQGWLATTLGNGWRTIALWYQSRRRARKNLT